jgi:NADH-quinone oxidoreductase subunit L
MALSVLIARGGILAAWRFYVTKPRDARAPRRALAGPAPRADWNKYYVDELYDATAIRGTMAARAGLDVRPPVVDGGVNGTGWLTRIASWVSHMFDKYVVDGLVNLVGWAQARAASSSAGCRPASCRTTRC